MPTYGVIDLGSNSIRLVIYEVKDDRRSTYSSKDFKSIINDKVMAGLAAFVEDGVFTSDGVDRAVNVLKSHMKRVRYFGCKRVDVFATAVLRNAVNCAEAVAEIERRCGLAVTLLSARDEAHLGFVGARCSTPLERGTLVDIGGGSTELTRVEGGRDSDDVSLGQGSLSSFARFVRNILPAPIEVDAIACEFRGNLRRLPSLEPYKAPTLYGVGGLHARGGQAGPAARRAANAPARDPGRAGAANPRSLPGKPLRLRARSAEGLRRARAHHGSGLRHLSRALPPPWRR